MVLSVPPRDDRPGSPDDYIVDRDARGIPITTQLLRIGHGVLLVVLAVISLALFWVVGLSLGIF